MVNKPLIRPYFWGGYLLVGVRLTSESCLPFLLLLTKVKGNLMKLQNKGNKFSRIPIVRWDSFQGHQVPCWWSWKLMQVLLFFPMANKYLLNCRQDRPVTGDRIRWFCPHWLVTTNKHPLCGSRLVGLVGLLFVGGLKGFSVSGSIAVSSCWT